MMSGFAIFVICLVQIFSLAPVDSVSPQDAYDRGHALGYEARVEVSKDAMAALMSPDSPLYTTLPRELRYPLMDQKTKDAMATLIGAVGKLRVTGQSAPLFLSLALGTQAANLTKASIWVDEKSGGNGLVTDLTDSLFFLPLHVVKPVTDQLQGLVALDANALLSPYVQTALKEIARLSAGVNAESGQYNFPNLGSYRNKATIAFSNHHAALLLQGLLEQFKKDTALHDALLRVGRAMESMNGGTLSADDILSLQPQIDRMFSSPKETLLRLTAYTNPRSEAVLYTLDNLEMDGYEKIYVELLVDKQQSALTLLTLPTYAIPEGLTFEQMLEKAQKGEMEGIYGYQFMTLTLTRESDNRQGRHTYLVKGSMVNPAMPRLGFNIRQEMPIRGDFKASTQIDVSLWSDQPLVTLYLTTAEVNAGPELPDTTGMRAVDLSGYDAGDSFNTALIAAMLMGRFYEAFPGEAESLLKTVMELAAPEGIRGF